MLLLSATRTRTPPYPLVIYGKWVLIFRGVLIYFYIIPINTYKIYRKIFKKAKYEVTCQTYLTHFLYGCQLPIHHHIPLVIMVRGHLYLGWVLYIYILSH